MSDKSRTIEGIMDETERIIQVWTGNTKFAMGDLTLDGLKLEMDKLRNLKHSREEERGKLSKLIDDTNDQKKLLEAYNTRARMAMKAIFGPDSAQYSQVGGTRASERKPGTVRKNSKAQKA